MTIKWKQFDKSIIEKTHGKLYYYRDLYEGNHSTLFSRAKDLIAKGEIVDNITEGSAQAQNVQTPYIIANISKLIPEIPAMLVSRSIGKLGTSLTQDDAQVAAVNKKTDSLIDGTDDETVNGTILDVQQELIKQIGLNSNLQFEHRSNILQHQLDGGLVGVPWMDERGLRLEFKSRDVYYPHVDGLGADLAYTREFEEGEEYLQVYRERIENGNLRTTNLLYALNGSSQARPLEEEETKELLGIDELETVYVGRGRPFISYWANEKTFMNPLGVSCLKNQGPKQDEINWTLTRSAITFERNGKPRIAVSKDIFQALSDRAFERYGDEGKIDHRDLEITTFDDAGKAMEIIQVDITKIGDIQWVKDLMKLMFIETKTSEKAVDFYMDGGSAAQSGVAKFYDLFLSLVKAEQIQTEYVAFLKQLVESALWLANQEDPAVVIEEPEIQLLGMIPISHKELVEENVLAFEKNAQSLETTVRRNNPQASEEWIEEELARIESAGQSDDTTTLTAGRSKLLNYMDNRDANGQPVEE
ncbi:hypothetical protein B481_2006 [Planococcus halocryophilus Or1]|uniref:Phage portal protein n=1 Tax=Planococcus halocryophilus TaxID=1215089 RepID=A0A1C7DQ02_9BACL|nr:hypothetical protein [Planococcus halocryophilus]ANU13474.1 hypothetical protein BBI08_06290 [Planococcus halocryophilus]EMF46279.1 hypothetical protein B481_2006 [Planococcus halocryophilus Or1]